MILLIFLLYEFFYGFFMIFYGCFLLVLIMLGISVSDLRKGLCPILWWASFKKLADLAVTLFHEFNV